MKRYLCADTRCPTSGYTTKPGTLCAECQRRKDEAERREQRALTVNKDNQRRHK